MRLDDIDPSGDIQDMGSGGGGGFSMGGGGGGLGSLLIGILPLLLGRKMGCGTIAILAIAGFFIFGGGMSFLSGPTSSPSEQTRGNGTSENCDTEVAIRMSRFHLNGTNVVADILASRCAISTCENSLLPRWRSIRMRRCPIRNGTILLPC